MDGLTAVTDRSKAVDGLTVINEPKATIRDWLDDPNNDSISWHMTPNGPTSMDILALFVASIWAICLVCWSCSIANNIACVSPSSSAAAASWAWSAASLKRDCFAVVAEYCFRSSHFSVKYVWSSAHVCVTDVLFSHATI